MSTPRREVEEFRSYCSDFPPEVSEFSERIYRKYLYESDTSIQWEEKIDTSDVGLIRSVLRILLQGGADRLASRTRDRIGRTADRFRLKSDEQYFERQYIDALRHRGKVGDKSDILVPYVPCREDYEELLYPVVNSLSEAGYATTLFVPNREKLRSEVNEERFNVETITIGEEVLKLRDVRVAQTRFEAIKPSLMALSEYDESLKSSSLFSFYMDFLIDEVIFERVLDKTDPVLLYGLHFATRPGYLSAVRKTRCGGIPRVIFIQHGAGAWPGGYPFHDFAGADKVILWGERTRDVVVEENMINSPPMKVIGSPKLQKKLEKHDANRSIEEREIDLFYPSTLRGEYSKKSLGLLLQAELAQELTVVYKPHPSGEKNLYLPATENGLIEDEQIVEGQSVAELASNAKIVVGTQSTALIEAIALNTPVVQLLPEQSDGNWNEQGLIGANSTEELEEQITKLLSEPEYYRSVLKTERKFARKKIQNIEGERVIEKISSDIDNEITRTKAYRRR